MKLGMERLMWSWPKWGCMYVSLHYMSDKTNPMEKYGHVSLLR